MVKDQKLKMIDYEEGLNLAKEIKCVAYTEVSSLKYTGISELTYLMITDAGLNGYETKEVSTKEKCLLQ